MKTTGFWMSICWFLGGVYVVEHSDEFVPVAEMLLPYVYPFTVLVPLHEVFAYPGQLNVNVLWVVVHW
jgi:hypothetical protein